MPVVTVVGTVVCPKAVGGQEENACSRFVHASNTLLRWHLHLWHEVQTSLPRCAPKTKFLRSGSKAAAEPKGLCFVLQLVVDVAPDPPHPVPAMGSVLT